jgi:mRNA interferase MazF
MVEQLTLIDPQRRLGEYAGRLGADEMQLLDAALRAVLALD